MKIFNFEIRRAQPERKSFGLGLGESFGWMTLGTNVGGETETGGWQRNLTGHRESILGYSAVYACVTLIASDIAKTRLCLVEEDDAGIWEEAESAAFSPVLRKPNHYQNRIKFIEQWLVSKLTHGNTYVLKVRDGRAVVRSMYILDPTRVRVLVAPDGSVFYQLSADNQGANTLADISEAIIVPAREIIHDVMVPLQHPLVGVSPIFACALAAIQGLQIQEQSAHFFKNGSNPGGIIMVPGAIKQAQADEVKTTWETKFKGKNAGKVAILSDGMKYQAMAVSAHDAQLIEQLKWSAETVCSCFHVPPYMIGVGQAPTYNNIEALNAQYYAQCLQTLIENLELCLDEGLELPDPYGTQFDLDDLLRMDTSTLIKAEKEAAGIKTINESRARLGLKPTAGGESVYLQEQNWPVRLLSERELPAKTPTAPAPIVPPDPATPDPATKALDLKRLSLSVRTVLFRPILEEVSAA